MKLVALLGVIAACLAVAQQAIAQNNYYDRPVPRPLPTITYYEVNGNRFDNRMLENKVVLMFWWQESCQPCKAYYPILNKLHSRYEQKGLFVFAPSWNWPSEQFVNEHNMRFKVVAAATTGGMGIPRTPAMLLISKGQIVAQWRPEALPKEGELQEVIEKYLNTRRIG